MKKELLLKFADFIETIPNDEWDFSNVVKERNGCKTVGCALGHLPDIFPEYFCYKSDINAAGVCTTICELDPNHQQSGGIFYKAAAFFGLTKNDTVFLFDVTADNGLEIDSTQKEVADGIRNFVRDYKE